jgi:hypothetical protein
VVVAAAVVMQEIMLVVSGAQWWLLCSEWCSCIEDHSSARAFTHSHQIQAR